MLRTCSGCNISVVKRSLVISLFGFLMISGALAQEKPAFVKTSADKLTLDQSVRIALEQSPVIVKARSEIRAAEGVAGQARAGFFPHLALAGGAGKLYSEPQTMLVDLSGTGSPSPVTLGTDEQADTSNYSVSLTQLLFTGGRLTSGLAAANNALAIAREELKKTTQELKFNVINAYYGVLRAQELVGLGRESVDMAKSHLERVRSLLKAGISTRADSLRAEVQLANSEISWTKAKQALSIARCHFNNALGQALDSPVALMDAKDPLTELTVYDHEELLKIAYQERPDWRQYILAKKITEDKVRLAYSGLWPMISLVGNYGAGLTKYPAYQNEARNWSALVAGSWNIFDGTATWNKIKEAQARFEAQEAAEISISKAIALEVKDANFSLQSAKEDLAGARTARELAEENFKLAETSYKSGVGTNLEVIDAQVALTQARLGYLEAQYALYIAKAKVNKTIGREVY